jgi:hypothetical protein
MKKAWLIVVLLLPGCASQESYEAYRQSFDRAVEAYTLAATEPLLSVELPSPVKDQPYKIVVNRDIEPMYPQQIKDSEWAPVVQSGVAVVGAVGGTWVLSNAAVDLVKETGKAAGVHMSDNARMDSSANVSKVGRDGDARSSTSESASVDVTGESSGNLDNAKTSSVTNNREDIKTTTTTRTNIEN